MKKLTVAIFLILIVAMIFGANFHNYDEYWKVKIYGETDSLYVPNGLMATRIHDVESMECDSLDVGKVVVDTLTVVRIDATDIDAVNESLDSTLTCDSISVRSIAGDLNGNATTATSAINADTAAWADDAAHADTSHYLGGGDEVHFIYRGLLEWTGNTERMALSKPGVSNATTIVFSLSGVTATTLYAMSAVCVTDSVVLYVATADTAAATGKTFNWIAIAPGP